MDKKLDDFSKKKITEFLKLIAKSENLCESSFVNKYLKEQYYKIETVKKPLKKQERNYRNIQKKLLK